MFYCKHDSIFILQHFITSSPKVLASDCYWDNQVEHTQPTISKYGRQRRELRALQYAPEFLPCTLSEGLAQALLSYIML